MIKLYIKFRDCVLANRVRSEKKPLNTGAEREFDEFQHNSYTKCFLVVPKVSI